MMRPFLAALALAVGAAAIAAPSHAVTRLRPALSAQAVRYTDTNGRPLSWSAMEAGPSVLIVLDPRRRLSRALLDELRRSGYDGRRARVVVLGQDAAATVFSRLAHNTLPQAQWSFAGREDLDAHVVLTGAPVVLGLDAGHAVAWRASGLPRQASDLLLRIADWTHLSGSAAH